MKNASHYLHKTLQLASESQHRTSPNPKVACLIVKNGNIIGQGVHQSSGQAHAEVLALNDCKETVIGADLYVNLEPCCHYGKTPPCTKTIIQAGIKRVFIAIVDPNPKVNGRGIQQLKNHNIEVHIGFHQELANSINRFYLHYIQINTPYIIGKWAMSLDGKMTAHPDDNRELSGRSSIKHAHEFRNQVDAILIGANTANTDNPQLTTRFIDSEITHHPIRIILSAKGSLRDDLKIFSSDLPGKTIVATTKLAPSAWVQKMKKICPVLVLPNSNEVADLRALLEKLGAMKITSLLVEGGTHVLSQFLSQKLVHEVQTYISPYIISDLACKQKIKKLNIMQIGEDCHLQAYIGEKP